MKVVYGFIFFLDMLAICWLAYRFFQGLDNDFPVWLQLVLLIALALAITLMVLFIRYYLQRQSDPDDK